jgi:deoxyribonuclease II
MIPAEGIGSTVRTMGLRSLRRAAVAALAALAWTAMGPGGSRSACAAEAAPVPLLTKGGSPVDWWFVFKFNSSKTFAGCGKQEGTRQCIFGGTVQTKPSFGQQFAFASSADGTLQQGSGCAGATTTDPIGATFDQVYSGSLNYLIWNDQFYRDPVVAACKGDSCGAPWGHSKGLLAWNDAGEGFVMQVSTPAWPRSGSSRFDQRKVNKGNTLGCNSSNNNLRASQHFFTLKLNKSDLVTVLDALRNASVVTDPTHLQIVKNGGPEDVEQRVDALGKRAKDDEQSVMKKTLSTGVILISKPSGLHVPPWQMVSALLSNAGERTATWWTKPWIYTTTKVTAIKCWDEERLGTKKPGPVAIATTGAWDEQEIKLTAPSNHAKIGVTTSGDKHYAIFGDLNQQGGIVPPGCDRSQNARGGLFFAVDDRKLFDSVSELIAGGTAPSKAPKN